VQQVLHLAHTADLLCPADELVDQLGRIDLAAQLGDALLDVHVHAPLERVLLAEELRLDL
jgi:hypothetical protein